MSSEPTTERQRTHPRRLERSPTDRVIGGVCGGIGHYLDVDPVVVRIVAVALALLDGVGVVLYIAAWLIMPEESADVSAGTDADDERTSPVGARDTAGLLVGAVLIGIGGLMLIDRVVPGMLRTFGRITWPLALIGIGVAILVHRR